MSTKDSKLWGKEDFATKENVFKFFENRGYTIGDAEPINPELVFQKSNSQILENVKELYQVVREREYINNFFYYFN